MRLLRKMSFGMILTGAAWAPMDMARAGGVPSEDLRGQMIGQGVECPLFRLADGEEITLTGAAPKQVGAYLLTGRWARFSQCMQGRSFDVLTAKEIDQQEITDDAD